MEGLRVYRAELRWR